MVEANKDIVGDLLSAVIGGAVDVVKNIVDELAWGMIRSLRDNPDELELKIQSTQYALSRTIRKTDIKKDNVEYQLGILEGVVLVCEKLFEDDKSQELIEVLLAKHRKWTVQILECIDKKDTGWGVSHTELAEGLGMSASNLSNHMSYILEAGVVQTTRTGKNRVYSLSASGKKYIKNIRKEQEAALLEEDEKFEQTENDNNKQDLMNVFSGLDNQLMMKFLSLLNNITRKYSVSGTMSPRNNMISAEGLDNDLFDLMSRQGGYPDSMSSTCVNKLLLVGALVNKDKGINNDDENGQDNMTVSYEPVNMDLFLVELNLRREAMENKERPYLAWYQSVSQNAYAS